MLDKKLSRRNFLQGALASTVVIGFDTHLRSWLTPPELPSAAKPAKDFPQFEGELLTDEASLSAAADDFGHIIHQRPRAVLKPKSAQDIEKLLQFARKHDLKVAARGQGHTTHGQSQVEAGVVIDMASLNQIHQITASEAVVEAGVTWFDLLQQTVPQGLTPPSLTEYLGLSVGGTLSVGGLGGQAFRFGAQTDNVLELQVVTGKGKLVTCSSQHQQKLFHAVRAGLGQFGVIVGARLRLVPILGQVRLYTLPYGDHQAFMADAVAVMNEGRFDYIEGLIVPNNGGWLFLLEVAKYFAPGDEPNNDALLAGLSFIPGAQTSEDRPYFDFANRLSGLIMAQQQAGVWTLPHPWVNLFVPGAEGPAFVGQVLSTLTVADIGSPPGGVGLLYPVSRSPFKTPFLPLPHGDHFFYFGLLRTATADSIGVEAMIKANRHLFEQVTALGGKRYAIDSVPMRPMTGHGSQDWQHHFQPYWDDFVAAKKHYDPENILTPGQKIFND